jgi:protein-S-isoprenylcysteine O-methyltransferase Ste14
MPQWYDEWSQGHRVDAMSTNAAPVPSDSVTPPRRRMSPWLPFKIAYLALALACLIQWGRPSLWSRIDFFSGGYLSIRGLRVLRSVLKPSRKLRSADSQKERWGSTAAPGWVSWSLVLTMADLAVFMDYGHWHLVPSLKRPYLQAFGLVLYLTAALWMWWTKRYLGTAFAGNRVRPTLMQSGPFRYIRHPYYSGAILERIAATLVFASAVGWLLLVPWSFLLLRQVRLEEAHLHKLFGREYETYTRQTARLIPGIY